MTSRNPNKKISNKIIKEQIEDINIITDYLFTINKRRGDLLEIEFYFVSSSETNLELLSIELKKLPYETDIILHDSDLPNQFFMDGKSKNIKLDKEILKTWVKNLYELGYKYGCELEGWEIEVP